MLFFSILFLTFSTSVNASEAVITTDNLNVRTGPGTNFEKIRQVHTDEVYQILQQQSEWVEIQLEESSGWVTTKYITIKDSSASDSSKNNSGEEIDNEKSLKKISIQYDNTQLRDGPSTKYEIVGFASKGTEFEILSEDENWYKLSNEKLSGYVLKQLVNKKEKEKSSGVKNKLIVIDAGHGGRDVGAIGASGTYEKDFNYKTLQELKQELIALGAEVVVTRNDDEFVSLGSRTSLTNILDTDAFISIHYNSVPSLPNVTGIGTYFYYNQYEKMAQYVQQEIIRETGARNRDAKFGDFHVIRQTFKPSILVELGFISNLAKEQLLQTDAYQKKLVTGIVNGLNKYFKNK